MNDAARDNLVREQAALTEALQGHGVLPGGFDASRLTLTAEVLLRKRATAVARAAPDLVRIMGRRFEPHFAEYAKVHRLRHSAGIADAQAFAQWLACRRDLTDSVMCAAQELLMGTRWMRLFHMHSLRRWWLLIRLPGGKITRLWFADLRRGFTRR